MYQMTKVKQMFYYVHSCKTHKSTSIYKTFKTNLIMLLYLPSSFCVYVEGLILNMPSNKMEAIKMLKN